MEKIELRAEAKAQADAAARGERYVPAKKKPGCGVGCLGLIVFAIAIGFLFNSCAGGSSQSANKYDAEDACQQFIKKRLKAPSTAKFGNTTTVQQDKIFKVTSVVDAENSFGVPMQSTWRCRVIANTSNDGFTLDLLEQR